MTQLTLDAAVDLTRTGDLWLFRGHSAADHAIRVLTNAPVNHVGMAVVLDDLPPLVWQALVSAEDRRYFLHRGVDFQGIARAMVVNLQAGELRQGGSTLTQQTAKNIYYRPDRSLKSKLTEALYALRLEAHYSKSDILEFYVNQFHVAGNGRGIGIAARHYFDKDVIRLAMRMEK